MLNPRHRGDPPLLTRHPPPSLGRNATSGAEMGWPEHMKPDLNKDPLPGSKGKRIAIAIVLLLVLLVMGFLASLGSSMFEDVGF